MKHHSSFRRLQRMLLAVLVLALVSLRAAATTRTRQPLSLRRRRSLSRLLSLSLSQPLSPRGPLNLSRPRSPSLSRLLSLSLSRLLNRAGPEPEPDAAAVRCQANRDAGKITFVTGFRLRGRGRDHRCHRRRCPGVLRGALHRLRDPAGFAPSNGALVIEGQAQFGAAGSFAELVANNVAGEGDLVGLLHWGRTAIEAIVLPAGSGIEDFAGLCGSLIGIKGDLPYSLQASVALSGIERSCFEEILLDGFDPVAHLDLGIDALPVYKSNEPNTLTNNGVPFTMLDPLDFDVPSSFGVTFTTQSMIEDNPGLVPTWCAP